MFEPQHKALVPRKIFIKRVIRSFFAGIGLSIVALGIGMWGYHHFEHISWMDAYVNAAMILSGMGPLWNPQTEAGKLFAGSYALFSGLAFLIILAVIFAPVIHRFLHKFHLEDKGGK